jgi:hypothetical protein
LHSSSDMLESNKIDATSETFTLDITILPNRFSIISPPVSFLMRARRAEHPILLYSFLASILR